MKWQPIETAPKDGTIVLVCCWSVGGKVPYAQTSYFDDEYGANVWFGIDGEPCYPTHWLEGFEFPDTKGTS